MAQLIEVAAYGRTTIATKPASRRPEYPRGQTFGDGRAEETLARRAAVGLDHARGRNGPVVVGHVVWFAGWIVINVGWVPGLTPFDPFPFPLLTMAVSLEAIFLSLFVLASQSRLSTQSDKRSHLDLQVDLLAEREMTAVLHLLQDIAQHLDVKTSVSRDQIHDLGTRTDIYRIAGRLDGIGEEAKPDHRAWR